MITYISFMLYLYLIPADVLPGNSTPIGISGALWNRSYPYRELYLPRKKTTMDKIGTGNENSTSFFVLLKQGLVI